MSGLSAKVNLEYNRSKYSVIILYHLSNEIPILLDRTIYKLIKKYGYTWYINDKNHVYTIRRYKGKHSVVYEEYVYIHDMVMRLGRAGYSQKEVSKNETIRAMRMALEPEEREYPIVHINKVQFDNRYANLQYDTPNKDYAKNTKKKRRTINLKRHGISVQELPTYVWYLKPDKTHGDRFCVEIPEEISWRSTSSKRLSLRYKLEEVKKYLRYLKQDRPDIFDYFGMNGDMSLRGKNLLREYNKMIRHAGFMIPVSEISNTDKFIAKDVADLTNEEIYVLYSFDPAIGAVDVNGAMRDYERTMRID